MGRAELRRQAKSRKKEQEKISKVLKNAGFPEFQLPPAPLKTTNLSTAEVANLTGTKIAVLEQWRKEQTEEIRKFYYSLQYHHFLKGIGGIPVCQSGSRISSGALF